MQQTKYQKFFYWSTPEHIDQLLNIAKNYLNKQNIPVARERQCESLYQSHPTLYVPPEVWSKNCYRQGSWFRTSEYSENHLLVTNASLSLPNVVKKGLITIIQIKNYPRLEGNAYLKLLNADEFKSRAPKEWFNFLKREIPVFQNFMKQNQIQISLDELLKMHSANHANFLLPIKKAFRCEYKQELIPCSLFPQKYICSACLELFGILGSHLKKMIVKKCPGLKYVNLKENEYFFINII